MKFITLLLALAAPSSTAPTLDLTLHDAAGRTAHATATLNNFTYDCVAGACVLYVDYTTDQLFCSAFGP